MKQWLLLLLMAWAVNLQAEMIPEDAPQKKAAVLVLSIEDCLELALGGNIDIQLQHFAVDSAKLEKLVQQEAFTGVLQLDFQDIQRQGPAQTAFDGAEILEEDEQLGEASILKKWGLGTQTDMIWTYRRTESNSEFFRLNPTIESAVSLEVVQPLMQGFGLNVNQAELKRARNNWIAARDELEILVEAELLNVFRLYWELVEARFDAELRQRQLEIAQQQLERARARNDVGETTSLDVLKAQAEFAAAEEAHQVSLATARNRGEELMTRIKPAADPEGLVREKILPTSLPPMTPPDNEIEAWNALVDEAMDNRPELRLADIRLSNADLDVMIARDRTKPRVDLYGHVRLDSLSDTFSDSREQVTKAEFPNYMVGARLQRLFSADIRKASLRQMMASRESEELRRQQTLQDIVLEVRDARANLISAMKESRKTELRLAAAEEALIREKHRMDVGRATALDVSEKGAARLEAELAHIRASSRTLIAVALLESAKGTFARDLIGQHSQ